jgi:predicted RND superfamily exporter protein
MLNSFIDSNKQVARISINMKDIGSAKLPPLLGDIDSVVNKTFDTSDYRVTVTGGSVTFLEGTTFIIQGLKDSIIWAFVLIAVCMLYLFRSIRVLLCSLIPNIVPLVITAGVMGWAGIAIKPSTVLVFSVALGIAIDVTIRFLVNYKQELPHFNYQVPETLKQTIRHTGISIIYTSLVLIAGFVIFCISQFGGTKALGWLTSLTLVVGTITNLTLLPVLIKALAKNTIATRQANS